MPVYNAQAYLHCCISSVLSQSYRDFELILVNDGSTDDSLQLCRRWEGDDRVRIITGDNRGVSHARNLGLDAACGDWIMFLDSDDYLHADCLERMMALTTPDTPLVIGAYTDGEPAPAGDFHQSVSAGDLRKMTLDPFNHHLLPEFYPVKPMSLCACWAKLYRADVIREMGLRFREELELSEDTLFNLNYLSGIEGGIITNLAVVHYRHHPGSVTSTFKPEQLSNRFRFFDLLKNESSQDAAVHILSLLLFEITKIEGAAGTKIRNQLEQEVVRYLSDNKELLSHSKNRALSIGRFQHVVYQTAAGCFRCRTYRAGFALLRAYAVARTKG